MSSQVKPSLRPQQPSSSSFRRYERHPHGRYERHPQVHDFFFVMHVVGHRQTLIPSRPAVNPHNTHLVQEHGTPGCGISGKAPKSPPSRAPAPHAFADRSVALPSPCTASAPCPTGRPLSRPLNLVWPLSIKLVTPPDHPGPPDHSLPPLHDLADP